MIKKLILISILALLLSGCAGMIQGPPMGVLMTDIKAPMNNVAYYGPTADVYTRTGSADCTSFFGLFAFGDASIEAAMQNGRLVKIHHITYRFNTFLFLVTKYTVIVYGE